MQSKEESKMLTRHALGKLLVIAVAGALVLQTGCAGNCKAESKEIKDLKAQLAQLKDELAKTDAERLAEIEKAQKAAKARLEMARKLLAEFEDLIKAGKLKLKVKNGRMIIEMPSAVLFASGKNELSADGKATLKEVAEVLATIENRRFQVAGHTDSTPKKFMKYEDNWQLSLARAEVVVKYLQSEGVPSAILSAAGYGEFQPETDNSTDEAKAQNRRIEITLVPNLSELPDLSEIEKLLEE
jgi:chemotaxis protein MotB